MPVFTFGTQAVYDPITDKVYENATGGKLVLVKDGPALPIWDLNKQPIPEITSNGSGQSSQFMADVRRALVQFGDLVVTVFANEVADELDKVDSLIAASQAAAVSAASAAQQAQQASDDLRSYIAANPPSTGGAGLPVGTTLDQIQNGIDRLAMTTAERTKLAGVAANATRLLIGTTAGTAKAGEWIPTTTEIGAVRNVAGFGRVWGRTAAQGQPTAAEGALDGDWLFIENA